jgi:acyl-CoA thioesterase FadM
MIAQKALERFKKGKFGEIFKDELIQYLEQERLLSETYVIDMTMTFKDGARIGDTILRVTLTLEEVKEEPEDTKVIE